MLESVQKERKHLCGKDKAVCNTNTYMFLLYFTLMFQFITLYAGYWQF